MKPTLPIQLRDAVQSFVREFGLLAPDSTPCGQSMPTSEAHALMILLATQDTEQCVNARDLAEELHIDKSTVSRMCARMEKAGLIQSSPCPEDGRVKQLRLSKKGQKLASQVESASQKKFVAVVKALPKSASPQVIRALQELTLAIQALDPE